MNRYLLSYKNNLSVIIRSDKSLLDLKLTGHQSEGLQAIAILKPDRVYK